MEEASITGVDEVIAMFQKLEDVPQTIVTNGAKAGANLALSITKANLQPSNGSFLGRRGKQDWGNYPGGTLRSVLAIKAEKSPKGKKVYQITTTWYARFKDLGFTDRNGHRIEGSHFLRYVASQHYTEISQTILDKLASAVMQALGGE